MTARRGDDGEPGAPHAGAPRNAPLSDAEIRAIAEQLVRELRGPPAPRPGDRLSGPQHELSPADEERVAEAVAALGAADPAGTLRSEREAAGEPRPRPASWGWVGHPPERAGDA